MSIRKLEGPWQNVYDTCLASATDYPFSSMPGFTEMYAKFLNSTIYVKQNARKTLSLTETSDIADMAAQSAVLELRSEFKDRCSLKQIVQVIRGANVMMIPGSKHLSNAHIRTINIVISIHTFSLSPLEIQFLSTKFGDNLEYSAKDHIMTIKCNEFMLEGPEPTSQETLALQTEAKGVVPAVIAYLSSEGDYSLPWRDFFKGVSNRISTMIRFFLQRQKTVDGVLDEQKLDDLLGNKD